jgi:hypothetical protein
LMVASCQTFISPARRCFVNRDLSPHRLTL